MKKIIIAIDGFSSCGKSTLAKQLAQELRYVYIDSGAMYRAVTLHMLRNKTDLKSNKAVLHALEQVQLDCHLDPETQEQYTILNNENVEREIRVNPRVASLVSNVSAISEVRKFLVSQQQLLGTDKGIIMDGRDIGTVVFPNAELKIFITADPVVRAQRRFEELQEKGQDTSFDEVLANLAKRDHIDSTRTDSPLVQADDAVLLDNSDMTHEEQFAFVMDLVKKKLSTAAEQ
jgi:cytidylate kinase